MNASFLSVFIGWITFWHNLLFDGVDGDLELCDAGYFAAVELLFCCCEGPSDDAVQDLLVHVLVVKIVFEVNTILLVLQGQNLFA